MDNNELVIECDLLDMPQYSFKETEEKPRKGRYHGSVFCVQDYGRSKWVVLTNIDVDWRSLLSGEDSLSEEDIVLGCIRHLNIAPPRKKRQRKTPVPRYGTFNPEPVKYKFLEENGKPVIQAHLVVDKRKHNKFWGEGWELSMRQEKKRGRPRKNPEESEE